MEIHWGLGQKNWSSLNGKLATFIKTLKSRKIGWTITKRNDFELGYLDAKIRWCLSVIKISLGVNW